MPNMLDEPIKESEVPTQEKVDELKILAMQRMAALQSQ
jgi:hypothetical protein